MTSTYITTEDRTKEHLSDLKRRVGAFIIRLLLTMTDGDYSWNEKLLSTLMVYQDELERRIVGVNGSQRWFQTIEVTKLMALLLASQHLDSRRAIRKAGHKPSHISTQTKRMLRAAIDEFELAHLDLSERFDLPDVTPLPAKFFAHFPELTREQAQHDADEFDSRLATTRATHTLEQVEACIHKLRAAKTNHSTAAWRPSRADCATNDTQ